MRVAKLENITQKEDIQIQTAFSKLGIKIHSSTQEIGNPTLVLKYIGRKGNITVIERTSIKTLLKLNTYGEGVFLDGESWGNVTTQTESGINQTVTTSTIYTANGFILQGLITVGLNGAIDTSGEGYFSLSVYADPSAANVVNLEVNAIEHPVLTRTILQYDPVVVPSGGVRKDISLTGVTAVGLNLDVTETIELEYPTRSISQTNEELRMKLISDNEVISIDMGAQSVSPCQSDILYYDVDVVHRMSLQPFQTVTTNSVIYLIKELTL